MRGSLAKRIGGGSTQRGGTTTEEWKQRWTQDTQANTRKSEPAANLWKFLAMALQYAANVLTSPDLIVKNADQYHQPQLHRLEHERTH